MAIILKICNKSAADRPIFTKFSQDDVEIGANLSFSQKLWKYRNPRWQMAAIFKIENMQ